MRFMALVLVRSFSKESLKTMSDDKMFELPDNMPENCDWCFMRIKATLKDKPAILLDVMDIILSYDADIKQLQAEVDKWKEHAKALQEQHCDFIFHSAHEMAKLRDERDQALAENKALGEALKTLYVWSDIGFTHHSRDQEHMQQFREARYKAKQALKGNE